MQEPPPGLPDGGLEAASGLPCLAQAPRKRVQGKALSVDTLSRNAKLCYDVMDDQPGAEYATGSWWQAFNAVTYSADHLQGKSEDNRLYSSWYGWNQLRKRDALKTALEFAEAA